MYKVCFGEVVLYFKNHSTLVDFLDDNIPDLEGPKVSIRIELI